MAAPLDNFCSTIIISLNPELKGRGESLARKSEINQFATISKALGHPARLKIVEFLRKKGSCICGDINEQLDLSPSTVSEHLRILKNAGLIEGEIQGVKRCYCLNLQSFKAFQDYLSRF